MELPALVARFAAVFPHLPPLGDSVCEAFPWRRLSLLSLPGGRRYPEGEADWRELVRRHRAMADAAIGVGTAALVVASRFPDEDEADLSRASGLPFVPWPGALPEELAGTVVAAPITYEFGRIETILRLRTEDGAGSLFVFGGHGRVYAPCEGGADLVLRDVAERDAFRAFFEDWVSGRDDGR